MLAYWGKRKKLINILRFENGTVISYEPAKEPGNIYLPLIENGKNVEPFEIIENEQISIFDLGI